MGQKLLATYAGVLTAGVTVALLSGFTGQDMNPRFDTLTVQRINVADDQGRERARLTVAANGTPSLEFLDAAGNVTHRYPPN